MHTRTQRWLKNLSVGAAFAMMAAAHAQTAFTYQGSLRNAGTPAEGAYDMRFRLYTGAGVQVGPTLCANDVAVTGGVFTVPLDFGALFATTDARSVEVEVRANTGLDCTNAGGFTVLAPRQAVTAAPRATHATTATALNAPDGSPVGVVTVDNAGLVGIGTTTPLGVLDVRSAGGSYLRMDSVFGDLHVNGGTDGFFGLYNDGVLAGRTEIISTTGVNLSIANNGGWAAFGTIPTTGTRLTVAGNLAVQGSVTIPATTRVKSIHGTAFMPDIVSRDSGGFSVCDITGMSGYFGMFVAPVELPHGAVVTRVDVTYVDMRTVDFVVDLGRTNFADGATVGMASVATSGASASVRTAGTLTVNFATVDNNAAYYWLRANCASFGGDLHKIVGVRITYTVTQPLP